MRLPNSTVEYLTRSLDTNVLISLKTKSWLRGILRTFDQHLNLIIDDAEEIVMPNSPGEDHKVIKIGRRVLVRGDNVVAISASPRR